MTTTGPLSLSVGLSGTRGAFKLDVAFEAPGPGVTALFGPSGSGKTTVLRAIAGLETLAGRITAGCDVWLDSSTGVRLPSHKRAVGYVLQEPSLFPHLSVTENLLYGARRTREPASARPGFDEIAGALGLTGLLGRGPDRLSGGERQRVAIGRALLAGPRVLLMDEPLASLDQASKDEILSYLERLLARLRLPVLYVTHDARERARLADHVVEIEAGRIVRQGAAAPLSARDAAPPHGTAVAGRIIAADDTNGLVRVAVAGAEFWAAGRAGPIGATRRVWIDAWSVRLWTGSMADGEDTGMLRARVTRLEVLPGAPDVLVRLALGGDGRGAEIEARLLRPEAAALGLAPGLDVSIRIGHAMVQHEAIPGGPEQDRERQ